VIVAAARTGLALVAAEKNMVFEVAHGRQDQGPRCGEARL
jgi:hypothetical protein